MTNSSLTTFFGLDVSSIEMRWKAFRRRISQNYLLLEFRNDSLLYAEAYLHKAKVNYMHVGMQPLPEGSVELGVPVDPVKMSGLLQQICNENGINVHRCSVILPPEASFVSSVHLPASLSADQAWDFVQSPDSSLQIPIPLQQTDFDIIPLQHLWKSEEPNSAYLLSGVPRTLVDSLIETLSLSRLELCDLCLSMTAQARLLCSQIDSLNWNSYILFLEFSPECTNAVVFSASGPASLSRLASIREFPEPEASAASSASALDQPLAAESFVLADDRYLPISELDVQVLIVEIKELFNDFKMKNDNCLFEHIYIAGSGSSHPGLESLLQKSLRLPVSCVRASEDLSIGTISMDSLVLSQSLGRLLGLGLHLISDELILDNAKSMVDASETSPSDHEKKSLLISNARILSSPSANVFGSIGQSIEHRSTESSHNLDQSSFLDQLNVGAEDAEESFLESISVSSDLSTSSLALNETPDGISQDLGENTSFVTDVNRLNPDLLSDQSQSQPSVGENVVDVSRSSYNSDTGSKEEPSIYPRPRDLQQEADFASGPFITDKDQEDGNIYSSNLEKPLQSQSSEIDLASSSANSQDWPSIRNTSLELNDEPYSTSISQSYVEADRDVEASESSNLHTEPSDMSGQCLLSNNTDGWPSALHKDRVVNRIEFSNEPELLSDNSLQDDEINHSNSSDSHKESESISSNEQTGWPSIRAIQSSNEHEPSGASSSSPFVPTTVSETNNKFLPSSGSVNPKTMLNLNQNKPEFLSTADQAIVSESTLRGEDESFGELRFADD